jgi:hypothetical protein
MLVIVGYLLVPIFFTAFFTKAMVAIFHVSVCAVDVVWANRNHVVHCFCVWEPFQELALAGLNGVVLPIARQYEQTFPRIRLHFRYSRHSYLLRSFRAMGIQDNWLDFRTVCSKFLYIQLRP